MMSAWLDKIKAIGTEQKVAGVEMLLLADGQVKFTLVLMTLKSGVIEVAKKITDLDSFEQVVKEIPTQIPVALSVNGKGLLHKKLNILSEDSKALISLLLPNAKEEDFYFQMLPTSDSTVVSIIRKFQAHQIIEQWQQATYNVVMFSIGPFAAASLFAIVEHSEIATKNFVLSRNTNGFHDYRIADDGLEMISIGTEQIPKQFMVAFASALQFLMPSLQVASTDIPEVNLAKQEYAQKTIFYKLGWGILIGLLTILLVNFIFFSFFSSTNKELSIHNMHSSGEVENQVRLEKDIKEREEFLISAGWFDHPPTAYLADRAAASIPTAVELTEMAIYPLEEKETRKLKKNVFENKVLRISGHTLETTALNPWILRLENIEGVENASIKNFLFDTKTNLGEFMIELTLNEDYSE